MATRKIGMLPKKTATRKLATTNPYNKKTSSLTGGAKGMAGGASYNAGKGQGRYVAKPSQKAYGMGEKGVAIGRGTSGNNAFVKEMKARSVKRPRGGYGGGSK